MDNFTNLLKDLMAEIEGKPTKEKISLLNEVKKQLHVISPFNKQPIDCVLWVENDQVGANDYNPNSVASPEMQLLECSIDEDGYTQPIVTWFNEERFTIVDGFHRHRVGKETKDIREKLLGYLPVTIINDEKSGKDDRIASTIRHNRARGKHSVDAMSEIVVELKKRNWTKERIAKHLGMDQDEILRLTQISGLVELFKDCNFSESWDIDLEADLSNIELEDLEDSNEEKND